MNVINYRVSLDMFDTLSQATIKAKKGDSACRIHITLTENGKIYKISEGCYATLSAKKSDGTFIYDNCTIEGNDIYYDFSSSIKDGATQITACEGIVECEVSLFKGDSERLTSPRFTLVVDGTVYNGEDIVSSNEADVLRNLINEANEAIDYIEHRFESEVTAELQEQIDGAVKKIGKLPVDVLQSIALTENQAFSGIDSKGVMQYKSATGYMLTDFIPLKKGETLTFNGTYRMLCAFTSDNLAIADSYKTSNQTDFTYTAADSDQYVQVVYHINSGTHSIMTEGSGLVEIEEGVYLNQTQLDQVRDAILPEYEYKNMLTGKKWVACGDSLTEGSSALTDKFTSGLYAGQKKTYPFFVGNRCGMDVVNLAKSGSTLSVCGTSTDVLSVQMFDENEKYLKEFADADYITIKIGTNDDSKHQNKPANNPPENWLDNFSDAWDTVLSYLTSNYPKKHLGIVVSNVADIDVVYRTIASATKWGVPYLNMATDPQLPLAYRSIRTDVTQSAKDARNAAFKVNVENDSHPNADWHEFESRLIESWLMTI